MTDSKFPEHPILMVDDEEHFLKSIEFILKYEGINNIHPCNDSREVLPLIEKQKFSLILLDLHMPNITGIELLPQILENHPGIPIIVITAENSLEKAVECIKNGATDYMVKPVDENRLLLTIRNALKLNELQKVNRRLTNSLASDIVENSDAFSAIITQNAKMKAVFQYTEAMAKTVLPVLITGETGTGKELLAAAIHQISGRAGKFVALNIAGEDSSYVSDTLFGHAKGGFTSAESTRKGLIEQAESGTLFLDEIGDLGTDVQMKLLRLLQERKYYPIGSDNEKTTNARFIFATNQDLSQLVERKKLRKDLYYRLQSHHIHIPPLRERKDDLPLLVEHFLNKGSVMMDKKEPGYPPELITLLSNHDFPGNVRELEGLVLDGLSRHTKGILPLQSFIEKINPTDANEKITSSGTAAELSVGRSKIIIEGPMPTLKDVENLLINKALQDADGNQTIAARLLGLSRKALNNRIIRGTVSPVEPTNE